ncbi:MAG: recombinase family protein, partial [Peptostreptococcaceae bacterium]
NIKHKGDINDEKYFYNWDFTTISYILKNKQYLGIVVNKVKDKEYIIENHHEPIIELDDFNKATDILSTRKKFKTRNNPLSNFVKCGCCGYAMCIMENISYEYYCCNKCGVYLRKNDVEDIIKKEVDKIVRVEEPIKNKNSIYKERTDINRRISNLEDEITLAILSDDTNDRLKELNNSISLLKDKLSKLENNKNNLFDINGNRLTEEEVKDYKKVAKILFSKGLFKRINKEIQCELIKI